MKSLHFPVAFNSRRWFFPDYGISFPWLTDCLVYEMSGKSVKQSKLNLQIAYSVKPAVMQDVFRCFTWVKVPKPQWKGTQVGEQSINNLL